MELTNHQFPYYLMSSMNYNMNLYHIVACDIGQGAWLHLKAKYEEVSAHALIELKNFCFEKLNINEDPDFLIIKLEQTRSMLESPFNESMEENKFKILIISVLTKSYDQLKGNL